MDRLALMAANFLVGNISSAAGLEAALVGPEFQAQDDCLVASAGVGVGLEVEGQRLPMWMAAFVRCGWQVRLVCRPEGGWAYLAVAGGLDLPLVMGSRSTYLRGSFGGLSGRSLHTGDILLAGLVEPGRFLLAGQSLSAAYHPPYCDFPRVAVLPGPQQDAFTAQGLVAFFNSSYRIRPDSDRMGYLLQGRPVEHARAADIISQGLAQGAMQVPADGQPLVAMSDHQTIGGYTQIAVVASADLPLLAQCPFESGEVRFYPTTLEEAKARYSRLVQGLSEGIIPVE
jgi:antagonist of KipI